MFDILINIATNKREEFTNTAPLKGRGQGLVLKGPLYVNSNNFQVLVNNMIKQFDKNIYVVIMKQFYQQSI